MVGIRFFFAWRRKDSLRRMVAAVLSTDVCNVKNTHYHRPLCNISHLQICWIDKHADIVPTAKKEFCTGPYIHENPISSTFIFCNYVSFLGYMQFCILASIWPHPLQFTMDLHMQVLMTQVSFSVKARLPTICIRKPGWHEVMYTNKYRLQSQSTSNLRVTVNFQFYEFRNIFVSRKICSTKIFIHMCPMCLAQKFCTNFAKISYL